MPVRLPAPLIHLLAVARPRLLRPDVRAASIDNVDFAGLRRAGFNAVVVDKDNCLTLPNKDGLFPPYRSAWENLLKTFDPGRVLIVSNSAGSAKDRGGIGAESLSLALKAPVLAHYHPKPACAAEIVKYFAGVLGKPRLTRDKIMQATERAEVQEDEAQKEMLDRWRWETLNGPLCGPLQRNTALSTLDERMKAANRHPELVAGAPIPSASEAMTMRKAAPTPAPKSEPEAAHADESLAESGEREPLRIIVVGDRLFTDTLLARRLDLLLPSPPEAPATLSIKTTALPDPNDVRLLRRFEDWLSGGELSNLAGAPNWSAFVRSDDMALSAVRPTLGQRIAALNPLRGTLTDTGPPMTWHPSTWRARGVAIAAVNGLGRGVAWATARAAAGIKVASAWSWVRLKRWYATQRAAARERAAAAKVKAEQERIEGEKEALVTKAKPEAPSN